MLKKPIAAVLAAALVAGTSLPALAAHTGGEVQLKSASGAVITAGSAVPYSPKQTCGTCHDYESSATSVTKQQTVGGTPNPSYAVPVPGHGVSAGFHFQQGKNLAWGDVQRNFYGLPSFTSSPGMYGKY